MIHGAASARRERRDRVAPRRAGPGSPDAAALLAALPNPVMTLDRAGIVRFVNPAAEQFFGVSAAALIGHPLADVIVPHSPLFALADAVWKQRRVDRRIRCAARRPALCRPFGDDRGRAGRRGQPTSWC